MFTTNLVQFDCISRDTLMVAVTLQTGIINPGFIASRVMPNSVQFVQYWVWSDSYQKWQRCQTFLAAKYIRKAALQRTVEAAKAVVIDDNGVTSNGWTTNGYSCNCPSFAGRFTPTVEGHKICKHVIKYSKQFLNIKSLSEYIGYRDAVLNDRSMIT